MQKEKLVKKSFWMTEKQAKMVEKIARKEKVTESRVMRGLIGRL